MKIGVIADTHSKLIPKKILDEFKKVDFIVHAGDFCTVEDYRLLSSFNKIIAVYGNMDEPALVKKLPEKTVFSFVKFLIGLTHGHGPSKKVLTFVQESFCKDKVDAVIFGHSHDPINQVINGVLYFNPGSPNDDIVAPYNSYGIIEIKDNQLVGHIIKV